MSLASDPSTSRERRLDEAIASFLAAIDAGAAPRADEWLAAHADLAPELGSFLQQYLQFDELANPLRRAAEPPRVHPPDATPPDTPPPGQTSDPNLTTTGQDTSDVTSVRVNGRAPASTLGDVGETGDGVDPDDHDPSLPASDRVRYFGDYELIRELGRGGMGVVYKARQVSLNRPVALKMIRSGALSSDAELRRFRNEAEAVALLDHPRIVPIFEVGSFRDHRYYSMRLVGGPSLADRLDAYRGQYTAIARLVADVAEAINHAHCRGVLHRDLKPANVLVDEHGAVHVTDFGLAKRLGGDSELTHTGAILGTPAYMAPEQASGRRGAITTATDVYGMGAILYALLTGHAPFVGEGVAETLDMVRNQPPEPPRVTDFRIPRDLEIICLKCLEKEPSRRYPTAAALAEDLRRFAAGEPIAARPVGALERAWLWCRRNRTVATLAALFATALVIGTIVSTTFAFLAHREATAAKHERDQSEGLRYVSEINAAFRDLEVDAGTSVHRRLADLVPRDPSQKDRRGFEWHLLRAMCGGELRVMRGHQGPVHSVALAPDGRLLATGGEDGTVRLWDSTTGKEVAVLHGPRKRPGTRNVAFSPDGRRLAGWVGNISFGGNYRVDYDVWLWDVSTRKQVAILGELHSEVRSLAFAPDGERLATGGDDGTVRLWDSKTGRQLVELTGHDGVVDSLLFAPDGRLLAAGGQDGTVHLWDTSTGRELHRLQGHQRRARALGFSSDGSRLVTRGEDGTVHFWGTEAGRELSRMTEPREFLTVVSNNLLAAIGSDGSSGIHDLDNRRPVLTLRAHGKVKTALFSPDRRRLAIAGYDGVVRLWDTQTASEFAAFRGHQGEITSLAFSPDGRRLASAARDGTARLWDASIGEGLTTLRGAPVNGVAFSSDGRHLAVSNSGGQVRLIDVELGVVLYTLQLAADSAGALAFSPDGRDLATGDRDGRVRVWSVPDGRERLVIGERSATVLRLAYAPDGRRIAGFLRGPREDLVHVWDIPSGREVMVIRNRRSLSPELTFLHDHLQLVIVENQALSLWDVDRGRERTMVKFASQGEARFWGFSGDGRLAVTSNSDTTQVWDVETGEETCSFHVHLSDRSVIALSLDGRRMVIGTENGTIRLLDTETGREFIELRGHAAEITGLAFSRDDLRLVSCDEGGTLRFWNAGLEDGAMRERREANGLVRSLLTRNDTQATLGDRVAADGTISEPVRSRARELIEPVFRARIQQEATSLIGPMFARPMIREEVLQSLCDDHTLDWAVREEAMNQASTWPVSERELYEASRKVVDDPRRRPEDYRRALRWVESASRLRPDSIDHFTVAVAQYRAGLLSKAVASLERCGQDYRRSGLELNQFPNIQTSWLGHLSLAPTGRGATHSRSNLPPDALAYLAMAFYQLGERQKARDTLERSRSDYERFSRATSGSLSVGGYSVDLSFARLREAEALILGDQADLPENLFAP
ncbi:MAG: protein kinase [Isosphaeraceae bacterium]